MSSGQFGKPAPTPTPTKPAGQVFQGGKMMMGPTSKPTPTPTKPAGQVFQGGKMMMGPTSKPTSKPTQKFTPPPKVFGR
jgi:hypothetical protein